ncbi:MAG TPA: hypothetical protein VFW19_09995 [Allosphingosinicella sp.]|nr:hypothetical protein [Allosphingosinicella sp.]
MVQAKPATLGALLALIFIYMAVLVGTVALVFLAPVPPPWRSIVVLIPLLPAAAIVRWELRAFARLDEMQLRNQIVALGWTFAISAALMMTYILLEAVGWPRLPMWVIFMAMMLIRVACSWVQWLRYK